ncbi:MAG: hypothetical protein ACI910_000403 [Oleispira sp.]|jgi:hypothetical protein
MDSNYRILSQAGVLFLVLLLATPAADFLTVYARYYNISSMERLTLIYRMLTIGVGFLLFLSNGDEKRIILWGSYFVAQFILLISGAFSDSESIHITETMLLLFKFFAFFIYVDALAILLSRKIISLHQFTIIFSLLISMYLLAIIYGFIFDYALFQNYDSGRWGVKGIIIAGNEASSLLIVALCWGIVMREKYTSSVILILSVIAILGSGTKAAVFGMLLIFVGWTLVKYGLKGIIYSCFGLFISLVILSQMYSFSPVIQQEVLNTYTYFEYHFDNTVGGSIISLLLSGRDYKLAVVTDNVYELYPWAFVIGGYPIASYTVEMDFFDLWYMMGIGSFFYVYYFIKSWEIKATTEFMVVDRFKMVVFSTYVLLAFTGGHFMYSAVTTPILAALILHMNSNNE